MLFCEVAPNYFYRRGETVSATDHIGHSLCRIGHKQYLIGHVAES